MKFGRISWISFNSFTVCISFIHLTRGRLEWKKKIPPVWWKKNSPLGSPDVSYSLPAIKLDKEKASSPSSASSLSRSLSPSGSSWRTERGILHWLKRLKSSRGLELLRLPGAPEEGQTFTGKEKRGRKKSTACPGVAGSAVSGGVGPLESLSCNWVNCWPLFSLPLQILWGKACRIINVLSRSLPLTLHLSISYSSSLPLFSVVSEDNCAVSQRQSFRRGGGWWGGCSGICWGLQSSFHPKSY